MTAEEIRDIAIDSSTEYYNYLDKNGKGVQEVNVVELEYIESRDVLIKLRLSAKLYDTEAIFFKNLKNNITYDTERVKVVEYDRDKNVLLIKPSEELHNEFINLKKSDIKIISDLKFLVQRVKVWYERNGASITLPASSSILKELIGEIQFFQEEELHPSENQKRSLDNLFTAPFSYIWGAPGTGKTQFVLSYAVLHYLRNNKKVAILAPTNNSIEQVLRGVLKMTDKAGVSRKQILRLGIPSKNFAEEFSEICEEKGVQKQLQEIDKQISILEKVLVRSNEIKEINDKEKSLKWFDVLVDAYEKRVKLKTDFDIQNDLKKKKEIDIKYKKEEVQKFARDKNAAEQRKDSFMYKLSKFFASSSSKVEDQIEAIQSNIVKASKELDFYIYEYEDLDKEAKEKQKEFENANNDVLITISTLKKSSAMPRIIKNN